MEISKVMLSFRAKHNLTQTQLAEILDVSLNTVHRIECNKNKPTKKNKVMFEEKIKEWEKCKND